MSKKKHIIRVGDRVKVINPFVFDRCGYPLGLYDMEASVERYEEDVLLEMLGVQDYDSLSFYGKKAFDTMKRGYMLYLLAEKGFGGPQRTIHTSLNESLRDKILTVSSIRRVVEGNRIHGSGEDDPPYLSNCKVRKILTARYNFVNFEIPEFNVIKVS